jgi:Obg family GTPase CgtA-like protein
VRERWPELRAGLTTDGVEPIGVSAHDGTGLDRLRARLADALGEASIAEAERPLDEQMRVHRFDPLAEGWEVLAEADGYRVRGRRIELQAARTDFENDESRDRFWRLLERLGIDAELRRQGAGAGSTVLIGPVELEWGEED